MTLARKDLLALASSNVPQELVLKLTGSEERWIWAATNGRLDVMQQLQEHNEGSASDETLDAAVTNGHLDVAQWLHEHYHAEVSFKALALAMQNRHYEVVKFLLENYEFTHAEVSYILLKALQREYDQ
jgi:sulfur relay (sulfurtransferase) DsrC/TusE family protein